MPASSKTHLVGQLQRPNGRPENVEIIVEERANITSEERAAGIGWVDSRYKSGHIYRYGDNTNPGTTDLSTAVQAACDASQNVYWPQEKIACNNITATKAGQTHWADGGSGASVGLQIIKNANGPIMTFSGANQTCINMGFRGEDSTPTFTGDNVVSSGDHFSMINCGSRWAVGRAVLATGDHVQILGTNDIYQTDDATATGFDIEIGVSGTLTLYHQLSGIYTSQSTGGIKLIDTGSHNIRGGQFGKLLIASGTSPAGINGGATVGARITGNVDVNLSNANFSSNTFGGNVTLTLVSGTSGHSVGASNIFASGATITDNSNNSNVVDSRVSVTTAYTPTWTAVTTPPVLGNGTISGLVFRRGNQVTIQVILTMGSTTTYGSGAWSFSVPHTPSTSVPGIGSALALDSGTNFRTGIVFANTGASTVDIYFDAGTAQADQLRPFTWATGDKLRFAVTYLTD